MGGWELDRVCDTPVAGEVGGWGSGGRGGHAGAPTPAGRSAAWAVAWELSSTEPAESSGAWSAGASGELGSPQGPCPVPAPGVEASIGGQAWDGRSLLLLQEMARVVEGAPCVQSKHGKGQGLCSASPREALREGGPHPPSLTVKPAWEWPWARHTVGDPGCFCCEGRVMVSASRVV